MIDKNLQEKINLYEQLYFTYNEPIPFVGGQLKIHPVMVKDYYNFYSFLPCLTIDKNIKEIINEDGIVEKVSNKEGMRKSYLKFLLDEIENKDDVEKARRLNSQLYSLLELIFHIPSSIYCPECEHTKTYSEALTGYEEFIELKEKEEIPEIERAIKQSIEQHESNFLQTEEGKAILESTLQMYTQRVRHTAANTFMEEYGYKCPKCGAKMRDIFSIKKDGKKKTLMIKNVEITPKDFDELKALVPRQNILDYDGDKYIDPDLKEELEIKQRLQNQDYTSPTLEKQIICVSIGTGFTKQYIVNNMTMRELSLYLRTIDAKDTYYSELQASMSGFVKFKQPPKHWIFGDSSKNIAKELSDAGDFVKKFQHVT